MATKPYMGRWRSKLTRTICRDACTQTMTDDQINGYEGNERTTQTEFLVDKFTNTLCNVTIQTNYFPDTRDRLVEAKSGSWRSGLKDPSNEKILESVVKIQRFYRAQRDRFTAIQPATANDSTCTKDTDEERIPAEPRSYRSQDFAILNRTSLRTRADFELLYNLLDRWRINETEKASKHPRFECYKIAQCTLLLSKEVELLRGIDSLKTVVKTRNKKKTQSNFLNELSRPAVWKNSLGESILVDTARVQCARHLRDTYNALSKDDLPVQKRIRMLRRLRNDIEPHTCKPSNDLLRLLDQEIDLLTCDVDRNKLNWLRNRSKITFLIFAREALENDSEDAILVGRKTICSSCGRLLPVEKFSWEIRRRRRSSFCDYCLCARNARTMPRIVYGPYEKLLRDIRRSEAGKNRSHTNLAFVVDAKIIHRLVNNVWHGKSAISECDRLDELRLVRLDRNVEWSPWNCLLLTANEASVHTRVDNLAEFYGTIVLHKFHTRNLQAKIQFGYLVDG
ncbi:IQ and ubiquitin-like domain-containing protein [Hylaeus anthracinus]|uniref:IQ and ubiquitin-like domain-containing protein n=1 Tax=Hylaeus anthracinus TaxID=313031 RepID=UPI0023B955B6|nr:IQ and ubiquitin-like domain-containing protein [Hylaeus anthracinus]